MKYQLLIFDWDGTLVDSTAHIVIGMQQIAGELNLPIPEDTAVKNIIGLGFIEAYYRLFPEAESLCSEFFRRYQGLAMQVVAKKEVLFAGVKDMLLQLKSHGYILAIATGKSRLGLKAALQQLGLTDIFAATRCAEETRSKPHPQMIDELLFELGILPSQALLIGDTEYDMQLAQNAGIAVVAVGCGVQPLERLRIYQPQGCINQTAELTAWLDKFSQISG